MQKIIIEKLDKIESFLVANKLTINVSKKVIMEIMLKQKRSRLKGNPPSLTVRTDTEIKTITSKTECFLLGGYLQQNMLWQSMIETGEKSILRRVRSKLGAQKYCCRKLSCQSKLLLANGLIISKILYLLPIFCRTQRKYLDKLQVVINNTAYFVTGMGKRAKKQNLMKS